MRPRIVYLISIKIVLLVLFDLLTVPDLHSVGSCKQLIVYFKIIIHKSILIVIFEVQLSPPHSYKKPRVYSQLNKKSNYFDCFIKAVTCNHLHSFKHVFILLENKSIEGGIDIYIFYIYRFLINLYKKKSVSE